LRDVFIAGVGQTAVNKDPHSRGRYLGAAAVKEALADADIDTKGIGALYVCRAYPLTMDEYTVVFQSKIFAAGHLTGRFPPELVDWLHGMGVITIGIDTPSVDPFDSKALEAHQALAQSITITGAPDLVFSDVFADRRYSYLPTAADPFTTTITVIGVRPRRRAAPRTGQAAACVNLPSRGKRSQ